MAGPRGVELTRYSRVLILEPALSLGGLHIIWLTKRVPNNLMSSNKLTTYASLLSFSSAFSLRYSSLESSSSTFLSVIARGSVASSYAPLNSLEKDFLCQWSISGEACNNDCESHSSSHRLPTTQARNSTFLLSTAVVLQGRPGAALD